jgi:hypothetical protein
MVGGHTMKRSRYIPKNSIPVEHHEGLGIAYVYRISNSRYGVIAYGGQRSSADFHEAFKTIERVHERVEGWFDSMKQRKARIAEYRAERFSGHSLKVGDVITNSWGYDQTNVDWYAVVKITRAFVWLQPIAAHVEETGFMSGNSAPQVDTTAASPSAWGFVHLNRPVEKHAAHNTSVSMKYGSGSKWNGETRYASWYA